MRIGFVHDSKRQGTVLWLFHTFRIQGTANRVARSAHVRQKAVGADV